jgi:Kef-type K+ transport system membrane component KefB
MIKFFIYLAIAFSPCWASDSGSSHAFVGSVALAMVLAGFCGLLCKLLHQPPLVGYLLAGMLLGPVGLAWIEDPSQIEAMSELGLILLLFMIGLEIDLKKMFAMGKLVWLPGLLQFPLTVCFLLCLLYFFPEFAPASWGGKLLLSGAFSLSSTLIVVKLLYQKRDLNAISGRMAVGILVFQDIWAILALAGQQQGEFAVTPILITVSKSILLILAAMIVSKYILPRLFEVLAKTPELVLIMSLSWCFLVSLLADFIGLSMEMGALMAGVAIATYPYSNYVITRITSIRDFFITLFFVGLGLQIPALDSELLQQVLFFTAVVLIARYLIFFSLLYPLKVGHRLSIVTPINLGQISEFSLILLTLGVAAGQIEQKFLNIGMWVFCFSGCVDFLCHPQCS